MTTGLATSSRAGDRPIGPNSLMVNQSEEDQVYAKITRRLVPLLFLCYLLAFLDRINVGYAQLQMKQALSFSDAVYGFGAGIFFISYLMFEVPSNLLLERVGVKLTVLRIMVLWGLTSAATMLVSTPLQFYIVRFLLGAFEAGFFPGIILYLTYWYPSTRRGRVTGQFMFAIPVAGIVGGPLSGWIMSALDGANGWGGWQWMFLLEGIPTCLLGVAAYFLLTNTAKDAAWLTDREKAVVEVTLAADRRDEPAEVHASLGAELRSGIADPRVWILALVYFTTAVANYTYTFWLPTMLKGLGLTNVGTIGWYSAIPYVFAALGIYLVARSSDLHRERRWHVAGSLIIGGIALSATTFLGGSLFLTLAVLCVGAFFQFGAGILFWAIPPTYLRKEAVAVGIALVSSIGVIGGFVSPTLIGAIKAYTGNLNNGIYVISGVMLVGALTVLLALPSRALRVGPASASADDKK